MNALMETIRNRRSIRKYEDRDVPSEHVDQILEAVRWAPSWNNCQCWEVIVVRDPEIKAALQTLAKGNPAARAMVAAPVLLVLCAKRNVSGYYKGMVTTKYGDWFMYDLGIANQNLCLTAHELGLGTVIVGLFDHDKANEVLGMPEGYDVVTIMPMGYPAKVDSAPKRRATADFTHFDTFRKTGSDAKS